MPLDVSNDKATMLMRRQEAMAATRGNWESMWEAVSKLVLPRSDDFRQKHSPGTQRNQQQYDAFPMAALDKFAAAIESATMPRTALWHKLTTGDDDLDDQHDVKLYMDELNQILWDRRYSPKANFSGQAHEVRLSLGAYGTGCQLVMPRKGGGAKYRSIHLSEIYIAENNDGFIDTVHRKFEMTARQAVMEFGKDTPQKILDKYNANKFDDRFEFLHCVGPREDYDRNRLDGRGMPFVGYYVYEEGKEIVREEGFNEMPYIVPRYSVSTREVFGRSPAIQLLPDISMLNEMRRTTIEAANMAVDPPVLLPDDAISEFDLTPGARNLGAVDEAGRPLAHPWNPNVDVRLGLEMIADTRSQIDDGFMGVYFRVLLENPQMTATQAMLIAQQQGQMTSPVVGRLQSEWAGPLIRRESGILFRQGLHPEMPAALQEFIAETGEGLRIEYQSPMTRAAKSEEAVGILRTFETLAPIAQIDPTVYDQFDTKEVAKIVAEVNGVPAKALKSDERLAQEAEDKQTRAQMGDVLEAAPIAAQTAKTLAETQAVSANAPRPVGV